MLARVTNTSGTTIKAIELVTRASLLKPVILNPPHRNPDYPFATWGSDERLKIETQQVENALKVFSDGLPAGLRLSLLSNESISNACASMQCLVGMAQIFLYDTDTEDDNNTQALAVVRRLLGVMHLLGDRDDLGDVGLFVVVVWSTMARLLVREGLRLESIGDTFGV